MKWKIIAAAIGGFGVGANLLLAAIHALSWWEINALGVDWMEFGTLDLRRTIITVSVGGTATAGLFAWLTWKYLKRQAARQENPIGANPRERRHQSKETP